LRDPDKEGFVGRRADACNEVAERPVRRDIGTAQHSTAHAEAVSSLARRDADETTSLLLLLLLLLLQVMTLLVA